MRFHQEFLFQAVKGGIDRADRAFPCGTFGNLAAHGHAVRLLAEPQDGQHYDLLKLTEGIALRHFYKVEYVGNLVKRQCGRISYAASTTVRRLLCSCSSSGCSFLLR